MPDVESPVLRAPPEEIAQILAPTPFFARFDQESLLAVAAECGFATYQPGTTIMRQGDVGRFACVIVEGEADVFVQLHGDQAHVNTLGRNRIIGELSVFTDMPRTATIIARTYLIVVRIEQESFLRLSLEYPSIGVAIIRDLAGQVDNQNRSIARLGLTAGALGRGEYDPDQLADLTNQPGEIGIAAKAFADMASAIRDQQNQREQMRAAAEIQQSILPAPLERKGLAERIDLHAEMHPAQDVGGDFYDYYMIDEHRIAMTVADVCSKGIPASLFMVKSSTIMRSVTSAGDLAEGAFEANRLLSMQNTACMFVTLFHGVLDLTNGRMRYCNAGHNPPYLLRAAGGSETLGATGVPFGIDANMPYHIDEVAMQPGDALFMFSDGITEAFNNQAEEFGTTRLEEALEAGRGLPAATLVGGVLGATRKFAAGADQSDDITCLAMRYHP